MEAMRKTPTRWSALLAAGFVALSLVVLFVGAIMHKDEGGNPWLALMASPDAVPAAPEAAAIAASVDPANVKRAARAQKARAAIITADEQWVETHCRQTEFRLPVDGVPGGWMAALPHGRVCRVQVWTDTVFVVAIQLDGAEVGSVIAPQGYQNVFLSREGQKAKTIRVEFRGDDSLRARLYGVRIWSN